MKKDVSGWLQSEFKKDVYYTGGHQCLKSGGQWPPFLHFVIGRLICPTFLHFAISSGVWFYEYSYAWLEISKMIL